MPKPIWSKVEKEDSSSEDDDAYNEKSGWKLDFIRTWRPNGAVEKLVILDAKYYDVSWNEKGTIISNQPGIGDIAKQIFYQMAFKDLACIKQMSDGKPLGFVNAFLFPEDDGSQLFVKEKDGNPTPTASECVHLGWGKEQRACAFMGVNLFAVRLPGIELLRRYANGESGDEWFEKIAEIHESIV